MAAPDLPEWAYIHIHNWARHQHYKHRRPLWIKNYLDQLDNEEYLSLTAAERGILHGSRLAYASLQNVPGFSRGLPGSTSEVSRVLRLNVSRPQLLSLNHAGLIDFSASKLLAQLNLTAPQSKRTELETERERTTTPTIDDAVIVLAAESEAAFLILAAIDKPGYQPPKFTRARFAPVVDAHPVANLAGEAEALADWEQYGKGAGKRAEPKDGISRLRNWLKKATPPHLTVVPDEPYVVGGGIYPPYNPKIHPYYPEHTDPFILPSQEKNG